MKKDLIEYVLKKPLYIGEMEITKLHIREPKYKHVKYLKGTETGIEVIGLMAEKLCEVSPEAIEELSLEDITGIGEILKPFLDRLLPTKSNA